MAKKDPKDDQVGVSETPNPDAEKNQVESWLRTIQTTEKWRDDIGKKAGWTRFISEYENDWSFLQQSVSIPIVPVNLVYAYVKTEIARLYFRDPWITVNAKRTEDIGAANIAEQVLNYMWGELKLKHEVKQALLEALLVGHSWLKLGYVAEFGTVESQPKEAKRGPGRPPKQRVETNEYVKSENVFAYQVSYKDVLFDPGAKYPATSNARWMAQKVEKPYRAVCDSGIYEHTDALRTSASTSEDPKGMGDITKEGFGKDIRAVVLYEIYDLDNQTITTVSPGCPYKLREVPLPDYLNGGFPFVLVAFNPVPGRPYPMSDIAPHEGQIIEMTKLLSIELNHLKRWNRQMIVDPDLFTEAEEAKFKDAVDGAIIKASQPGAAEKLFIPPYAPVQSDVYGVWNQIYEVWRNVAGQTQADQGGQAKTQTRTLGELRMQLQGSKARAEEKVNALEDAMEELARKLLTIMQKKFDLPKLARIVGDKAIREKIAGALPQRPSANDPVTQPMSVTGDQGFTWTKTDIMGEMDVDVLAGSTVPLDRESQLEIMEKLVPMLAGAGITPGSDAAKKYAREMLRLIGIPQLEAIMDSVDQTPPPPPPGQAEAQAEMQAKQAELQMKQAESQMKIQGQQATEQLKLKAMQDKLAIEQEKMQLDLQKKKVEVQHAMVTSILQQFRGNGKNGEASNGGE